MMKDFITKKIKDRLKGSPVRSLLAREFEQLMSESEGAYTSEELAAVFSRLLADELCIDSVKKNTGEKTDAEPPAEPSIVDFDRIYNNILHDVRLHFIGNSLQMLKALGAAVAMRDTGNSDHNYRVTIYSIRLAENMGLNENEIRKLLKGSFLHDIGKISISDTTLLKQGKLNEEEIIEMRNHVLLGAFIIKDVKWLEDATDIVRFHHERWDGAGYHAKLKGQNIPLLARVFAIADVYDALTSKRPYKEAILPDEARLILKRGRSSHFDPDIYDAFIGISKDAYNEVTKLDHPRLDACITKIMDQYFGVNPEDEDIRPKNKES